MMTLRRADSAAVHHVPFLEDIQLLVIKVTHADVFKDLFFIAERESSPTQSGCGLFFAQCRFGRQKKM